MFNRMTKELCWILLILFRIAHVVSQMGESEPRYFVDNCKYLIRDLCEEKIEATTKGLLADVQCVQSKYPSCSRMNPATIKSLKTFNEFICSRPSEACKLVNATLSCHLIDQESCRIRDTESGFNNYREAFKIGADYGWLNCMIGESKDENVARMCVKKDELKVPQEPKAFVKWYFEEADMNKLHKIVEFCGKKNAIMGGCSRRLKYTMVFCELRNEYTDAFLSYRLKRAGYSDIPKAVADYCKEDKEVRNKLGDLYEDADYEFAKALHHFWHRYNLCHLKDPRTIDLELSKAFCYSRKTKCVQKAGPLPTERSQMIEWLCRENFYLPDEEPTAKGDFFAVKDACFPFHEDCRILPDARQILCLQVENVSRTVDSYKWIHFFDVKSIVNKAEMRNLQCLSLMNERAVSYCYKKVTNGLQVGDRLNTAICNSNQHYYELNITGCLRSHEVDLDHISTCKRTQRHGYSSVILLEMYELIDNCTIPLYGKGEVEKCSLKHLSQSFWTSRNDFSNWLGSDGHVNSTNLELLWPFQDCLSEVRRSKKLDEKYERCSRTVNFKLQYEKCRKSCQGQDGDVGSAAGLIRKFNCKIQVGAFNRTGECSKALEKFKSINETVAFAKWLCDGANEDGFIQLSHCGGEMPEDKLDAFASCMGFE